MRVKCLDNSFLITPPDSDLLTVNKAYNVEREDDECYWLYDNTGELRFYRKKRFKAITQPKV